MCGDQTGHTTAWTSYTDDNHFVACAKKHSGHYSDQSGAATQTHLARLCVLAGSTPAVVSLPKPAVGSPPVAGSKTLHALGGAEAVRTWRSTLTPDAWDALAADDGRGVSSSTSR